MSKSKTDKIESIMQKRLEKQKEEKVEQIKKETKAELPEEVYAVITDPVKKGRNFLIAKLKFDIKSMKAMVVNYAVLDQKVIGMRFPIEQENLRYYYEQSKKLGDKQ